MTSPWAADGVLRERLVPLFRHRAATGDTARIRQTVLAQPHVELGITARNWNRSCAAMSTKELPMTTAHWIAVILLTPFWWGMGLFTLAVVADLFPSLRHRVFALFNWIERTRYAAQVDVPNRVAA